MMADSGVLALAGATPGSTSPKRATGAVIGDDAMDL